MAPRATKRDKQIAIAKKCKKCELTEKVVRIDGKEMIQVNLKACDKHRREIFRA